MLTVIALVVVYWVMGLAVLSLGVALVGEHPGLLWSLCVVAAWPMALLLLGWIVMCSHIDDLVQNAKRRLGR